MRHLLLFFVGTFLLVGSAAAHEPDTMPDPVSIKFSPVAPSDREAEISKTEHPAISVSSDLAQSAQPAPVDPATQKVPLVIDEPLDASGVAYDLTMTWMKSDEWQQKVATLKSKFQDWESTNGGDIGQYLNDRLILVAMGCANGRIDSIKNGFVWLAYYKEFNQQVPTVVATVMRDHRASLLRLFKDFTWEKASQYVKNKEWRKDFAKKQ